MGLIDTKELSHRLCNGFISHDGYVDGEFVDVFKDNGFELFANNGDNDYMRFMEQVIRIVESMPVVDAEPVMNKLFKEKENEIIRLQRVICLAAADMKRMAGMAKTAYESGLCSGEDLCGVCAYSGDCDRVPTPIGEGGARCFNWRGAKMDKEER